MDRRSLTSSLVALLVACGGGGQTSGTGNGGDCGALTKACCALAPACDAGLSCLSGTCQTPPPPCGGAGEACCSTAPACGPGLACSGASVCDVPPAACNDPYAEAPSFAVDGAPTGLAAGDVDADGDVDLVVCGGSGGLFILRNDGMGHFVSNAKYAIYALHALVADVNGDGKPDVVVTNGSNKLYVLLGPGPATSGWLATTTGNGSIGAAAADLNGDGHLDLVTANTTDDTVSVLLGRGDGTFAAKVDYAVDATAVPMSPTGVALGDLDGDGWKDIAVVGTGMDFTGVFLNSGTGTFGVVRTVASGSSARQVAIADLDADGRAELVVPRDTDAWVDVLFGTGGGAFTVPMPIKTARANVALAVEAIDAGATPDIITLAYDSQALSVLLGQGAGTMAAAVQYPVARQPTDLVLADFDGDGYLDVAVSSDVERSVQVFRNDGTGILARAPIVTTASTPDAFTAARLNADPYPDLVYVSRADATLTVLLGLGDGRFTAGTTLATGAAPVEVAAGDFNADGAVDLVTANTGGTVSVLLGAGDGTFASKQELAVGASANHVAVGDFNGDSFDDILVSSPGDGVTYLLRSKGDGTFQLPVIAAASDGPLTVADLDRDGRLDFTIEAPDTLYVLGNGDATFATPVSKWMNTAFVLGDVDGDGDLDVVERSASSMKLETWLRVTGTTYTYAASRAPPANLAALALPDADGDGFADIAAAGDFLTVDMGRGDGFDRLRATYGSGYLPKRMLAIDLDADGRDDLVIQSIDDSSLRILMSVCP